jgi:hypothetical protein
MSVIPKISGVPRASMIRRTVAVKPFLAPLRSGLTAPACTVGIAFKNHAAQSASPMVIPNHRRRNRNAPNGAAAEMDQIPVAVVAASADG